jgi:hypothetical protein
MVSPSETYRRREVLNRNENAGETLLGLVDDLSRRFYAGVICLLLVLAPLIFPSRLLSAFPAAVLLTGRHFWCDCGLISDPSAFHGKHTG